MSKVNETFEYVLHRFIEKCITRGREPATIRSYRYFTKSFLVPALGDRDVRSLHFRDLEGLYQSMLAGGYIPSTIHKCHTTASGSARIKGTKTGNVRRVTLDAETAAVIRSHPGPFVHGGESPHRTDLMSKRFRRVAIRAGLPNLKARLLRHFHATQLLASRKLSDKQIADRLGHSNPMMLNTVYGASLPALDIVAADVIAGVLPVVTS